MCVELRESAHATSSCSISATGIPPQIQNCPFSLGMLLVSCIFKLSVQFSCSVVSDSATPWTTAHQASLSITNSQSFTQTHVHLVSDAMQPSHPLSSTPPPAFNLSQQSGSFPVSQFFLPSGQSIGASASASVLPMNIQD